MTTPPLPTPHDPTTNGNWGDALNAVLASLQTALTNLKSTAVQSVNGATPDGSGNVAISTGVTDATTGAKGVVQLTGDLAGTATAPTVPGLAAKLTGSLNLADVPDKVAGLNNLAGAKASDVTTLQTTVSQHSSALSALQSAVTALQAVGAGNPVTALAANTATRGQVTLTWTAPSPTPSGYTVSRNGVDVSGGTPNFSTSLAGSAVTYAFMNLADSTSYTFTVTPTNGQAKSITATTAANPGAGAGTQSLDGATVTGTPSNGTITNAALHSAAISSTGVITWDGNPDGTSNNVTTLYYNRTTDTVYQLNTFGQWYTAPYPQGPGVFQATDPRTGSSGGTSGSGPLGITGTFSKLFEDTFTASTLNAEWIPNRWAGTLPTNEATNIPAQQLDTSYSGNVQYGTAAGLKLIVSNQVDSTQSKPYCGAHLTGTSAWLRVGRVVEYVVRVAKNGSCWPSLTLYDSVSGGPGGEIDLWEILNCTSNPSGWLNDHNSSYTAQTLGNTTGNYSPSVCAAGDGKFHTFGIQWVSGTQMKVYVDGVLQQTFNILGTPSVGYIITLELGVENASPATATPGTVIECSRISVWG